MDVGGSTKVKCACLAHRLGCSSTRHYLLPGGHEPTQELNPTAARDHRRLAVQRVFLDNVFVPRRDRRRERRLALARTTLANEAGAMATGTALGSPMEELLKVLGDMELDVAQQRSAGRLILLAQAGALLKTGGSPVGPSAAGSRAQSSTSAN